MTSLPLTADAPILAAPRGAPEQCVRFLLARPHGEYTEQDIAGVIVPAYFAACTSAGVDPVVAIAQLVHETGCLTSWWSQRPRRNPAGIGVTGRSNSQQPARGAWAERDGVWYEGVSFATWKDDAIPAHVGRLLAYTLRDEQAAPPQLTMITRALGYRPLPAAKRAVAATLRGLGGTWAVPGTTYGEALARIANRILAM
ncbi:MAG: glucosaminidase domain-containing protein [Roseiflexaceae bacterium]